MTHPPVTAIRKGEWRRDIAWGIRCKCGHDRNNHRLDGDRKSHPCTVTACGCNNLRPEYVTWRESRTVYGLIEETS